MEKQCYFCTSTTRNLDYKDAALLRRFLDPSSRIFPKKRTGLCAFHQRRLSRSVKRARTVALLPFLPQ